MNERVGLSGGEIDLRDLCCLLWRQRWLICAVSLATLAGAAAYAFLAKPVYQVDARISPPTNVQLSSYHELVYQLDRLMPEDSHKRIFQSPQEAIQDSLPEDQDLYREFKENLQSSAVQSKFISRVLAPGFAEQSGQVDARWSSVLNSSLTISVPRSNPKAITVAFSGEDPKRLSGWLNGYLDISQELTREQIQRVLAARQGFILKLVREDIRALRNQARADRMSAISQVQNALSVAKAIGLQDASPQTHWSDNMGRGGDLMYLRGVRALTATLTELQARTDDDAYISTLPPLLEKERQLQQLNLMPKLEFAYIDRPAFIPSQPVKPRRSLIVALGGVLGLMLGVFAAFVRQALR